jgi:hypothetical protein
MHRMTEAYPDGFQLEPEHQDRLQREDAHRPVMCR